MEGGGARRRSIDRTNMARIGSARWTARGAMAPFVARATPAMRPAPPTGTTITSASGTCSSISTPSVPAPGDDLGGVERRARGCTAARGGGPSRTPSPRAMCAPWITTFAPKRAPPGARRTHPNVDGRRRRRWRSRYSTANFPCHAMACAWLPADGPSRAKARVLLRRARFPDSTRLVEARREECCCSCCRCRSRGPSSGKHSACRRTACAHELARGRHGVPFAMTGVQDKLPHHSVRGATTTASAARKNQLRRAGARRAGVRGAALGRRRGGRTGVAAHRSHLRGGSGASA